MSDDVCEQMQEEIEDLRAVLKWCRARYTGEPEGCRDRPMVSTIEAALGITDEHERTLDADELKAFDRATV